MTNYTTLETRRSTLFSAVRGVIPLGSDGLNLALPVPFSTNRKHINPRASLRGGEPAALFSWVSSGTATNIISQLRQASSISDIDINLNLNSEDFAVDYEVCL